MDLVARDPIRWVLVVGRTNTFGANIPVVLGWPTLAAPGKHHLTLAKRVQVSAAVEIELPTPARRVGAWARECVSA